ncbi:OLC1v1002557C1 [Oldenlandia corymbosa var. corymbosa]|uniref:Carboxypeptidase n=1 Tax=Oldenlandia corymbosa var. corymbosa TaxID=529605 RepID=A0AAV1D8I8_OLDCO|nr:OLC1v1002557C1 [Oldenlandia corymbosa var. corymbosa]
MAGTNHCGKVIIFLLGLSFWLLILGAVLVHGCAEDLVEKLPGQPFVPFKQYAGYVDVDKQAGRSLFYYFAEAEKHANHKPLTLWLNGGPGCSSVGGGAFTELGPFFPTGDGRGLRRNKKSWNRVSNLLFVESPVGVGWSYSNTSSDYQRGDDDTAEDTVKFLLGWFEKFPLYKSRPLFLTGESYAGHYIPQLTNHLLEYNEKSNGFKFNIKGVAIGNPLLRLDKDSLSVFEYYWSHGMMSDELWDQVSRDCDFNDYTFTGDHNQTSQCNEVMNKAYQVISDYVDPYDVFIDVCYDNIAAQELRLRKLVTKKSVGVDVCMTIERKFYFQLPEVQKALHANRTNIPYPWSMCSSNGVLDYNSTDANRDMIPLLKSIIEHKIPLLVYSGDQDSVVPLIGTRTLMRELAKDLNLKIAVDYRTWFHKDQVGGWQIKYGDYLTFATVRGAGHMVPYSQPARALELFGSFVRGKILANSSSIHEPND